MITYNNENALTFIIPPQQGCSIPDIDEVQSYSFGGYGSGISFIGVQQNIPQVLALGTFVKIASGKWGVLLGDEFQPQVYRGQNKDFPSFSSSFARLENDFSRMIAWIQRKEFKSFFIKTPYYTRCREFSVLDCKYDFDFEAIFQHYGFKSSYIDITKDLFVALFFAYTRVDSSGNYHPIEDFTDYSPTLYVTTISALQKAKHDTVVPISLQMLHRPINQMAMALNVNDADLKPFFCKYELPKDSHISIDIYQKFKQGKNLFQKEPVADIANEILNSKKVNNTIVKMICAENEIDVDIFTEELKTHGYEASDVEWSVGEDVRIFMNDEIDRYILPFLDKILLRRNSSVARGI